tara:strand:- start:1305 stop:1526 length:222 start_codon:yes stop_codon:yes gene_type:complete
MTDFEPIMKNFKKKESFFPIPKYKNSASYSRCSFLIRINLLFNPVSQIKADPYVVKVTFRGYVIDRGEQKHMS